MGGNIVEELVRLLDENLQYISHEIIGDVIEITVVSNRLHVTCPYCGQESQRVHSKYSRSFQDLPMQGKKVKIILLNRKLFCDNDACDHKTFAERFDFLESKAKKSTRLKEEIIEVALTQSSISASRYLDKNIATVKKSTICNYIKKKKSS
jgi:transposase